MRWLLLALLALGGCIKETKPITPQYGEGYGFYRLENGDVLVVTKSSGRIGQITKEVCKGPCTVESLGEVLLLRPLSKEK